MKAKTLFHNGRILTQAGELRADSIAICRNSIVAVGNRLEHDPDFRSYSQINLRGRTVIPGLVDAHTHFHLFTKTYSQVSLNGLDSLDKCLRKIKRFTANLPRNRWVVGGGLFPDGFHSRTIPDRYMLDRVTGGRPAFIFFKDTHSAWINSKALEFGRITGATPQPDGGRIELLADGSPSGILREMSAYLDLYHRIPPLPKRELNRCYDLAVNHAYRLGITGVHSFDGPDGFEYFADLAERNKLGLRINYYPRADLLSQLEKTGTRYGTGTKFFRIAGVKLFADGALGSQSALCFSKYLGSKDNRGIEVLSVAQMKQLARRAARLGLPCAIHAIGDKAVANVLEAFESIKRPRLRHRIEHLQLVRRKDLARVKRLGVVASMQPSHCPSDIGMARNYWGRRSTNAYVFRTVLDKGIPLAFGSDAPIEPLDPIAGIAAAVRRARPNSRDVFHPEQRIFATEALHAFTVGSAIACGQEHQHGYLLPGYRADFVVLDRDLTRIAPSRIYDTRVLATILDGKLKYCHSSLRW
ncbi:MAG: amidohydrolase [candidate division Zixibacteria bacterium]|nr:amidohydrolase [candidate division Zixibacteria bacterium]